MSLSLSSRQGELAGRRTLVPVPLVTITTYSDRAAATVDTIYRFSDEALVYGGDEYEPMLIRVNEQLCTMTHIPDPNAITDILTASLSFVLKNMERDTGNHLITDLEADNLMLAQVEVWQLLLYEDERGFNDIRALAGTEHLVFFRGEIKSWRGPRIGEITFECRSELPKVPQLVLDGADVAPKDRGKRVNLAAGDVRRMPIHNIKAGKVTTLSESASETQTALVLTDASEFSASSSGNLEAERISWTTIAGNQLQGVTRGNHPIKHPAGAVVVQVPTTASAVVGQKDLTTVEIYMRNPVVDELYRLPIGSYSVDADDETWYGSGNGVSTVNWLAEEMRSQIEGVLTEARVTIQPQYQDTNPDVSNILIYPDNGSAAVADTFGWASRGTWGSMGTATPVYTGGSGPGPFEYYRINFTGQTEFVGTPGLDLVTRARIRCRFQQSSGGSAVTLPFSIQMWCRVDGWASLGWPNDAYVVSQSAPLQETAGVPDGQTLDVISSWFQPPEGTQMQDYVAGAHNLNIWIKFAGTGGRTATLVTGEWGIEFTNQDSANHAQVTQAEISALSGGVGLELYADTTGPPAPTVDYVADAGVPILRLPDVVRYYLEEICAVASSEIDDTNFAQANTNMANVEFGTVFNEYGITFDEMLATLMFDSRSQLTADQDQAGRKWRLHQAIWSGVGLGGYTWDEPAITVTDWQEIEPLSRDGDALFSEFRFQYNPHRYLSGEDRYQDSAVSNAAASGLVHWGTTAPSNAEEKYGERVHPGYFFESFTNSTTLNEVGSYYIQMNTTGPKVWAIRGIPWPEGYALQRNDIIEFTPPWQSTSIHARVIETAKSWTTHMVSVRCVEVETD